MSLSEVADLYIILRAVTKPFTEAMAAAGAEGEAAGKKISGGISKVSPVIMGIAAATGLAAVASVKWATDFETQYTRLFTAAGASKDAVLANRDAMLQLGTATGFTGTQIAEALYHPVSAGLDLATALQVVKASAEEARISGASLDDTTYSLSGVMKAFNIPVSQTMTTMAQLNAIVGDGDMRFQDFNQSIKNWAPTAAAMNISVQSMGAGLAYLTDRNMKADEASTRMTMGIAMMATPSAQAAKLLEGLGVASADVHASSSAMTDALKKAHITQNDLAQDLQKPDGLYVALTHLKKALQDAGVSGTEADSLLSKIFGGGRSDKAILSLMQNLDQLKQKYDQIGKDSTAKKFQQDWEDAQKSTAVEFDKLKATVINLGIQLGMVLMPIVKDFLGYLSTGIDWLTKHRDAMLAFAAVLSGAVAGALTAVTISLYNMAAAAMANPIVDIVAALALGAVLVVTHWQQVKQFFEGLWAWVSDHKGLLLAIFGPIFPFLTAFVAATALVVTHWKEIWAYLKRLATDISGWAKDVAVFFSQAWSNVSKDAKQAWQDAVKFSEDAWGDMKKAWNDTLDFMERMWNDSGGKLVHEIAQDWDKATSAIGEEWHHAVMDLYSIWDSMVTIWDETGGRLKFVWVFIVDTIKTYIILIKTVLKVAWDVIAGTVKTGWDLIANIIKLAWDYLYGIVKTSVDLVVGLLSSQWDLVKAVVKAAWDIITGIINVALDSVKDILKLFADLFSGRWSKLWGDVENIAKDLWNNIWKTIKGVLDSIIGGAEQAGKDLIKGFSKAISDGVGLVFVAAMDIWKTITNFFADAGKWLWQAGKNIIQGLIDGVKSMFDTVKSTLSELTDSLPIWKGPPEKDKMLLHDSGRLIMQGLINGISSQKGALQGELGNITDMIGVDGGMGFALGANAVSGGITSRGALAPGVINIYVEGSVLSSRDLRDVVQEQMLQLGARYSTSYTPYKR